MDQLDAVSFDVPGRPVPWARTTTGKGGRRVTPRKQRDHAQTVAAFAAAAMVGPKPRFADGPVALHVDAIYPYTQRQREPAPRTGTPDADNLAKLVGDALNGIAYTDDAQIAELHVWKRYGPKGMTRVTVSRLTD